MDESQTTTPSERHLLAAIAGESQTWTPECLEPEKMIALAEESLPEAEAATCLSHVTLCARCRQEYAQTRELLQLAADVRALEQPATVVAPSHAPDIPRRSFWQRWLGGSWRPPALGVSLAAVACAGVYFGIARPARLNADRLTAAVRAREASLAQAERARQAATQEVERLRQRHLSDRTQLAREVTRLRAQTRVQVARLSASEAALAEMSVPVASWRLAPTSGQVRGVGEAAEAPPIVLLAPVDVALVQTRPTLECQRVDGATAYQATLEMDGEAGEPPTLDPLSATRWVPRAPLRPGVRYRWAVSVTRGDELLQSVPARFYVLSEQERTEADQARKRLAGKPLALAAVFARLGLRDDARATLQAIPSTDPASATARRWLRELTRR